MEVNSLTPTTELGAVNDMLSAIGETPIDSLEVGTIADAEIAQRILNTTSRSVQSKGLHSNTEKSYRLNPNTDGELWLPANTLRVDEMFPQENPFRDLVQRGNRLYDRSEQTYKVNEPVDLEIILMLPFDQLPEATRHYVTIKAARILHDRTLGDQAGHQFTKQDEMEAKAAFKKAELSTKDVTMLRSTVAKRIINRRRLIR